MFVLCKNKETKDLLTYGFEENVRPFDGSIYYTLDNSKGTRLMSYEDKFRMDGLSEEKCKILYELITNGIIENIEINTKEARIKKIKEKIDELNRKLKELEVE